MGGVVDWVEGGGMRRKRHHTLSKIIERLSASALSGAGSRTVWIAPCMDQLIRTPTVMHDQRRGSLR
jgi:hypothetical protein